MTAIASPPVRHPAPRSVSFAPPPTLAAQRQWLSKLRELVTRRDAELRELDEDYTATVTTEQREYDEALAGLTAAFDAEQSELAERFAEAEQLAIVSLDADAQQIEVNFRESQSRIEREHFQQSEAVRQTRDNATWLVSSVLDDDAVDSPHQQFLRLQSQVQLADAELTTTVDASNQLRDRVASLVSRWRMVRHWPKLASDDLPNDLAGLQSRIHAAWEEAQEQTKRLQRRLFPRLFGGGWPFLIVFVLTAALGVGVVLGVDPLWLGIDAAPTDDDWRLLCFGCAAVISTLTVLIAHAISSSKVNADVDRVAPAFATVAAASKRWRRIADEQLKAAEDRWKHVAAEREWERNHALQDAESRYAEAVNTLGEEQSRRVTQLRQQTEQLRIGHRQRRDASRDRLATESRQTTSELSQRRDSSLRLLNETHTRTLQDAVDLRQQRWHNVCVHWSQGWFPLADAALHWNAAFPNRDWAGLLTSPTQTVGQAVLSLGRTAIAPNGDLPLPASAPERRFFAAETTLPLVWNLSEHPGLVVETPASARQSVVGVLQAAMLRLIAALPAGRVRFTILDPIGLGESFSAFMHLADVDELLVTSRIWTEPSQIEQRLADITEHMETVLQMFLRNEYATLDEYNAQAGEVAEPYRVLVIADLPASFSDLALRRLQSILTSGPRCGVIPLMSINRDQPWPKAFALDDLTSRLLHLRWDDGLTLADEELSRWPLQVDSPPEPALFTTLIRQIGESVGEVRRVEVPFERVAPSPSQRWTRSSAKGLDVPIGRAGATKLQSIALGSGTSQHVLIAGKTGSGKSTLLHALVCSASLHYSPDEVEFYLIDFKKGVEFQVYARGALPHARVIAMESDREFGVSVLERLDDVLRERSELFRKAGAADLPTFRQMRPEQPLPRILLVIDEFQEFFVEDDQLSQTAALLFDRLVRQGRAFGVHVVLGSQTLAGAYSLARSTLGQIAIRIALQCSETDAHLILSEENTAARLLTRPGEAIYNDANGLKAGNRLFQIVWQEEADRLTTLHQVASLVQERGGSYPPAIVFEGNVPADLRRSPLWGKTRSVQTATGAGSARLWLGEAVNLHGVTTLDLAPTAGANLLVVGADEEAATGVLTAVARSALIANETEEFLLGSGSPTMTTGQAWDAVAHTSPQLRALAADEVESQIADLVKLVREREGRPGPRRWLCLFDLARFRKLRKADDDYGFGSSAKVATPSQQLAELLRDGPAVGVHVLVWCDSLNTVGRWLSREMQQQFEFRVAFLMNANDSSQLLDNPCASRLGPHRAWLFRGDQGTLEKFRPYAAVVGE